MNQPPVLKELPPKAELRRLFTLAWPVIIGQLGLVTMGTVDVAMVGSVGGDALAAVGIGHLWTFGVLVVGFGVLGGLDPIFSQAWGAGDTAVGSRTLARAGVLALLLSVPLVLLHLAAGPALLALGQPPEIVPVAAAYCAAIAPSVAPVMLQQALARYLQGRGEMKLPMFAVLLGNLVNIAGNWLLVRGFSLGDLVVPAMGAVGCGVATSLVRFSMFALLLVATLPMLRKLPRPSWAEVLDPRALWRLFAVGGPVGFQHGLEVWAFCAAGLLMGLLGSTEVAAHAVAINLSSLAFMIPFGLGAAAATRVGNLIGAGLPWGRSAWMAVGLGTAWMSLTAVLFASAPTTLASLYTQEAPVVATAALLLPIAAAFQLFDGVQAVTFGVLRGAGDTRMPALVNLFGYWMLGLPLAAWMGVVQGPSPQWVWGGLALGLLVVAGLLLLRLRAVIRKGGFKLAKEADAAS